MLYVPNDNRCTDPADGTPQWCFLARDQTWSLPALDPDTDRLYMGSNYPLMANVFGVGTADGKNVPETLRVYLMVDAHPAAVNTLD